MIPIILLEPLSEIFELWLEVLQLLKLLLDVLLWLLLLLEYY